MCITIAILQMGRLGFGAEDLEAKPVALRLVRVVVETEELDQPHESTPRVMLFKRCCNAI